MVLKKAIKMWYCYALLLPTLILLVVFNYYPAISALYHSLFRWDGFTAPEFVGLKNFAELLFHDEVMAISGRNIAILSGLRIVIALTVPLLAAELVFNLKSPKAGYAYRSLFVIPMVVPAVVNLLIWKFIYDPNYGVLNEALRLLGLGRLSRAWLGDYSVALYSILFVGFPWISGLWFLIFLAGLQNIPPDLFDAALIDGASSLRRIINVDIPCILGQIKLVLILSMINALQGYVGIMILTNGGPGNSTMVPGLYLYQNAFYYNRMGYGCAVGVILFVILFSLTYVNMKYIRTSSVY